MSACLRVSVSVCFCVCLFLCLYVPVSVCPCACVFLCLCVCLSISGFVCLCVLCLCVCLHVSVLLCLCAYIKFSRDCCGLHMYDPTSGHPMGTLCRDQSCSKCLGFPGFPLKSRWSYHGTSCAYTFESQLHP